MKAPVGLLSRGPVCEANAACSARQGHGDFDALQPGGDCSLLAPKENQKGRRCPEGMKAPVGLLSRRPVCEANAACLARQGHSDFDALEPTGCGPLRLLRALGDTRILQAAAPTAPPCIRHWRRSSPLQTRGCSPLVTPKQKSKRKNASRFAQTGCGAQRPLRALSGTRVLLTAAPTAPPCIRRWRRSSPLHFFLASPIDRPLSRCGGSSPQGSGSPLSVTFGDTLSPFCRCATSSPDRGKSFKGRGKKRSLHGLGSPFGRAGAKRLRGLVLPQAATDAK